MTGSVPSFAAKVSGKASMHNTMTAITGGASGIGLAVGEEILKRGGNVTMLDIRSTPQLEALQKEFGENRVYFAQADVTDYKQMEAAMKLAADHNGGRIDCLVNNAGIQIQKPFDEQTPESFRKLIDINLFGKIHGALAAVPYMKAHGGHIINTSSVHGHVGSDERGPYCAAMHGTIGLTKSMAADLAQYGIQVHSISPAFIDTPLAQKPLDDMVAAGKFQGATAAEQKENAVKWRLQYQGNQWVSMDDVVSTYVNVLDGTTRLATGQDIHDDAMTRGYIDAANGKGGAAIFNDAKQQAVDGLNAQIAGPWAGRG